MKRTLRTVFVVIEINLLLWLAVCGMAWANTEESGASWWHGTVQVDATLLLVGVGFAAIAQHWAYYALCREVNKRT
ncbi:MAG: hypothetical protein JXA69_13920 [Phycisphaerae bacterium]|nr:hypothetical protein [Phycisphaerae bacterium]